MKTKLLFSFIFIAQLLSAQTFVEAMDTPFDDVWLSSIAFADVDGDNDQDLFITGRRGPQGVPFSQISKLYINDGAGNFTEAPDAPFHWVDQSSVAFADIDGDGDQDLFATGWWDNQYSIANLYTNDGGGNFTEVPGVILEDVLWGSVAFSDVDGDNDQDLLITGSRDNLGFPGISKLYVNDGMGNFTEATNTPFEDVSRSAVAFSDVDGDNDQDVLIAGVNNSNVRTAKLYTNDGLGNFAEVMDTPFLGVRQSAVAFSDVDGNNTPDVLITGWDSINVPTARLYTNDGMGNFTEVTDAPFEGVFDGSITFADVDGDNDQDVLITGENSSASYIAKLYANDGSGNFIEVMNMPFEGVTKSSIAFADVDGDNDPDVFISGGNTDARISKLYINETAVSIENLVNELSFEFKLYPNPTKTNIINVNYDSKENAWVTVNIFDLEGRLLQQHQEHIGIGEQTFSINISSLSKGAYTIQLDDSVRTGIHKFVVE